MSQVWIYKMSTVMIFLVAVFLCFINQIFAATTTSMTTQISITTDKTTTEETSSTPPPTTIPPILATTITPPPATTADGDGTTSNDTSRSSTDATSEMSPSSSTIITTEETTTTTTTTTTAAPEFLNHNTGTSFYTLKLTVGPTNKSDIQYMDANMTETDIREQMKAMFKDICSNVRLQSFTKEAGYTLMLDFFLNKIDNKTGENIDNATKRLPSQFKVPDSYSTKVQKFMDTTSDICKATNVCPLGFRCIHQGCEHLCKTETCSMHGTCVVRVLANEKVGVMCNCDITFETEYEGEHCENSRQGKEQIIAIVAGVLGGACFLLIIILIIVIIKCSRSKRKHRDIVLQSADYYSSLYYNTPVGSENYGMNGTDVMNGTGVDAF